MKKVIAVIVTMVIGYFFTSFGDVVLNWPQMGSVAAVATMGVFILNEIEKKKDK